MLMMSDGVVKCPPTSCGRPLLSSISESSGVPGVSAVEADVWVHLRDDAMTDITNSSLTLGTDDVIIIFISISIIYINNYYKINKYINYYTIIQLRFVCLSVCLCLSVSLSVCVSVCSLN